MLKGKRSVYLVYIIIVGLSALLVSTDRAMREPQDVKRAQNRLHVFLYMYFPYNLTEPVVVAAKQHKTIIPMKEMNVYEAPQVEIIEVEVEKGFAVSDMDSTPGQ